MHKTIKLPLVTKPHGSIIRAIIESGVSIGLCEIIGTHDKTHEKTFGYLLVNTVQSLTSIMLSVDSESKCVSFSSNGRSDSCVIESTSRGSLKSILPLLGTLCAGGLGINYDPITAEQWMKYGLPIATAVIGYNESNKPRKFYHKCLQTQLVPKISFSYSNGSFDSHTEYIRPIDITKKLVHSHNDEFKLLSHGEEVEIISVLNF